MEKKDILAQVDSLTAEQLFDFIKIKNIVSYQEVKSTNILDASKRKRIDEMILSLDKEDESAWERVKHGNEAGLRDYISSFPAGKYIHEAKMKIQQLDDMRRRAQAGKQRVLNTLSINPNAYPTDEIITYLQNGTITQDDLINCGIPAEVLDKLQNIQPTNLRLGDTPDFIPSGFTEVYFWGIPGSGKTCALAAILNTADKAGYLEIATGPGHNYTTKLKNLFSPSYPFLPAPSPVETTQYLPFTLKKTNESQYRSVSLIELSGEIFQCFFLRNAGLQFPSERHQNTFNTLLNYLGSANRKIHFFFIDYDTSNSLDADGYCQSDYLAGASTFFKNNQIFGKSTDAIYIVLTKSDKMDCPKEQRIQVAKEHLNSNFLAFVNILKSRCKEYSINAGILTVEPFSLGKVYFKQICEFDNSSARVILDILMDRVKPAKTSILDYFNR